MKQDNHVKQQSSIATAGNHLESCLTRDDCLFMVFVEALDDQYTWLVKQVTKPQQYDGWQVVGLHQRWFVAREHGLH